MKAGKSISAGLVLIGTVHHDPLGYDTLLQVLSAVRPDIITLELSPYGRGFRTRHSRKLSRRIVSLVHALQERPHGPCPAADSERGGRLPAAIEQLLATVTLPFEYRAVRDYAATRRVPFYCIDLSRVSREKVRLLKAEALTAGNIETLLTLPDKSIEDSVNLCYKRAAAVWHERQGYRQTAYSTASERDVHMSRRLRNYAARFPDKIIAHIAGWEHCSRSTGTVNLYGLLQDLSPRRILLDDARSENRPVP